MQEGTLVWVCSGLDSGAEKSVGLVPLSLQHLDASARPKLAMVLRIRKLGFGVLSVDVSQVQLSGHQHGLGQTSFTTTVYHTARLDVHQSSRPVGRVTSFLPFPHSGQISNRSDQVVRLFIDSQTLFHEGVGLFAIVGSDSASRQLHQDSSDIRVVRSSPLAHSGKNSMQKTVGGPQLPGLLKPLLG